MSHIPQRKEKDCLNCGTIVQGRYCHVCGQENVVPKEGFWHMVTHFFYDITHFDSKFFTTTKDLLLRPGFLSKEYMKGRRASYLHPVKMYVFTSAVFFLIFFSFFNVDKELKVKTDRVLTAEERGDIISSIEKELQKDPNDHALRDQLVLLKDTARVLRSRDLLGGGIFFSFTGTRYRSQEAYDSIQRALPPGERDGWLRRRMIAKEIELQKKSQGDPEVAARQLLNEVLHRMPYMLFVSLPLFALLLKLVYFRRKQFFYVDHGIFTIHLYIFSFVLLLAILAINRLKNLTDLGIFNWLIFVLSLAMLFYLYKAMRNFYGQGRVKTLFKFIIVSFFSSMMMLALFVLFMVMSAVAF